MSETKEFPEEELAELKAACFEYQMPDNRPTPRANVSTVPLMRLIAFVEGLRAAWKDADLAFQFADEEADDRAQEHGDCSYTRRAINAANAIARIKAALPAAPEGGIS